MRLTILLVTLIGCSIPDAPAAVRADCVRACDALYGEACVSDLVYHGRCTDACEAVETYAWADCVTDVVDGSAACLSAVNACGDEPTDDVAG